MGWAKWLNENQGVVAVLSTALIVLLGWFGGLFKLIFKKVFNKQQQPYIQSGGDIKSEGPMIIGNQNTIIYTSGFLDLEKQVSTMESKLQQVLESMREQDSRGQNVKSKKISMNDSEDYGKVSQIISGDPSPENKTKLKSIYYSTTDKVAQLQIILSLAEWFAYQEDNLDDLLTLCDDGIRIADGIGANQEKGVLLAYKGDFVSIQFVDLDRKAVSDIHFSNTTGIPLITEEERKKVIEKLGYLDKLSEGCFKEAEKSAKESKSYMALGFVYMQIGIAAGLRFIHLNNLEIGRAKEEKQLAKRAFMIAKEIYSAAGDELKIAYAYYKFANQLIQFGESKEAIELLQKVQSIASKHNEQHLLQSADTLSERIKSGKIPGYMQD